MAAMAENLMGRPADARTHAAEALALLSATSDGQAGAWSRLELARALIGLRAAPAEIRALLVAARTGYAAAGLDGRVAEVDALLAGLRARP